MSIEKQDDVDYSELTDEQLGDLQRETTLEQQRRAILSGIPVQIAELAEQYRDGGGEQDVLDDAVAEPTE